MSDGIVLQFAQTLSRNVGSKNATIMKNDQSLVQLNSSSAVCVCPSSVGLEADMTSREWTAPQPLNRQASRSLSAVKRKQRHGETLVGGGTEDPAMDEVLQALKKENESLNLQSHSKSQLVTEDIDSEKTVNLTNVQGEGNLKRLSSDEHDRMENKNSASVSHNESSARIIKGPVLPALPFKPVIVNRYKSNASAKPSGKGEAVTRLKSAGGSTHLQQQQSQPTSEQRERAHEVTEQASISQPPSSDIRSKTLSSQRLLSRERKSKGTATEYVDNKPLEEIRGKGIMGQPLSSDEVRGGEVASHSLTEHTVRIITDKVRQMDAR